MRAVFLTRNRILGQGPKVGSMSITVGWSNLHLTTALNPTAHTRHSGEGVLGLLLLLAEKFGIIGIERACGVVLKLGITSFCFSPWAAS